STAYLYNPQSALLSQKGVFGSACPECKPLTSANSTSAWLVPTLTNPSSTAGDWRLPAFSDTSWARGQPCLGYEFDPLVSNMILYSAFDATDVVNTAATRTVADISGPAVFHTGTWLATNSIGIPVTTPAQIQQSVQFYGPNLPAGAAN